MTDNPSTDDMGNVYGAIEGYEYAAYHRDIGVALGYTSTAGLDGTWSYPPFSTTPYATDMNCYSYGYGYADAGPQRVSLTEQSLGYAFIWSPPGSMTSYLSAPPGGPGWENYLYYGGLGNVSGVPFNFLDPNGGTYDYCCSTAQQNGIADDQQCPNSQSTTVCP